MSSSAVPRCQHIKVSGTQCGSPALRQKSFCFYHQQNRPMTVECYSDGKYSTGEIELPVLEDAHSIQTVIRQVVQLLLQKRIERKTASLLLYGLQIASSNLKHMEEEKPQPAEVVTDPEALAGTVGETNPDQKESQARSSVPNSQNAKKDSGDAAKKNQTTEGNAPPGITIEACCRPESRTQTRRNERKKQYVI